MTMLEKKIKELKLFVHKVIIAVNFFTSGKASRWWHQKRQKHISKFWSILKMSTIFGEKGHGS